ncbi:MAG: MraY family glycosyltransferase [Halioglobus sp.]|nr:MraY family glycosyltransferase [Halioglobus sp.]
MIQLLYLYSFFIGLLSSLILIPLLVKYASKLGLVDNPVGSLRKLHKAPMPRSGGLGIIIPTAIAILVILPWNDAILSFLVSSLVIVGFGLLDDVMELKPAQKLIGQTLGVCLAMVGGMVISTVPFIDDAPIWMSYALTFVFVMAVINGVNFSDGMDGLAAGTTLMALVVIFLLAVASNNAQVAIIAASICAALVGFLRFNTHPATIFMGDAGSQFLGFSVAWLAITLSQAEASTLTPLLPLLILGIPIMDVLQVVCVRVKKKLPLPGPDKEHFHHQIAKLGLTQASVVATVYILQLILLFGAFLVKHDTDTTAFGFYVFYLAGVLGLLYLAHMQGWTVGGAKAFEGHNRRNGVFRRVSALHPYSGKFYGAVTAGLLWVFAVISTGMPKGLIYIALIVAISIVSLRLIAKGRWTLLIARVSTYTASTFCVYGMTLSLGPQDLFGIFDLFLISLTILLAISIRTTRKKYFWLTPQDLLVLFFVILLAPSLSLDLGPGVNAGALVYKTILLLYLCEYVLARGYLAQKRLTTAALFSLFLLSINL